MSREQVPEGYRQTAAGIIPEDWDYCSVGQMGAVVSGKALAVNEPGQQRPYLRTKNVFDGRIDIDDVLKMPMTDAQFSHFKLLNGDVLLNEGQSLELVGRCAIYQDEYPEPCAMQNQLLRFRAYENTSAVFASHLFRYCQQTGVFSQVALQTTSIAHLGTKRFERLLLPWPKRKLEQDAIASTLSDIDNLLASLDRLIAKKRDLKQATMQQLLTGKKRLPGFFQTEGYKQTEIGIIPNDWEVQPLRLALNGNPKYGINAAAVPYEGKHPAYIRITDISESGHFQPDKLVSVDHPDSAHYFLEDGDLVFARTGASVGKSYLYDSKDGELVFAGFLIKVEPNQKILNPHFLSQYVKTRSYWNWVQVMSMRSGQPGINGNEYGQLLLPFPSIKEQSAIAQVLTDMDTELTTLQTRRHKTQALKQAMMQELLTGKTRLPIANND